MFNHAVAMENGGCVLYNFLTGKSATLNILSRDYYDHFEVYGESHPIVKKLIERGFLVETDELETLRQHVMAQCNDGKEIVLTICPTLRCNFGCPYCFETPRNGKMTKETQDEVVMFVQRMVSYYHTETLKVVWFGGEPLLECEIIRSLSKRFVDTCEKTGVKYKAAIITNGYFLTPDKASMFEKCNIRHVQITMDGPISSIHDKTRHLIGGGGTFDRILDNIKNFKGRSNILVRCNVHRENAEYYQQLEKMLMDISQETGQKITVVAGHMIGNNAYEDKSFSIPEYVDFYKDTHEGIKRVQYKGPFCGYPMAMDFVIDEQGYLSKCLESVNHSQEIVGHVRDFEPSSHMSYADEWQAVLASAWPQEDEECMQCKLLPVCLGGCPRRRRMGEKQCSGYKYVLDDYVLAAAKRKSRHGNE